MENTQLTLGENLKGYRTKFGYTQEYVAQFLGLKNREVVSYYENGEREITVEELDKLCDLYGIQLEELLETDKAHSSASLAFAFRADDLSSDDLESISDFKKVVMNYLKIRSLEDGEVTG